MFISNRCNYAKNLVVLGWLGWLSLAVNSGSTLAQSGGQSGAQSGGIRLDEIAGYRFVERTVFVKEPVTLSKWVEETQYETREETEYRHITQLEKKEKRTIVKKPVTRSTVREERVVTRKPITETRYREREIEETNYDLVTEMREEQYYVQRPVIETQYRDEQVTVRQKISEDLIEVSSQTVYRPQTVFQTVMSPTQVPVVANSGTRLEWLQPGYYFDPVTGQSVYRRRGLHWVQSPTVSMGTALVPTTVETSTLVPETLQTRRPVEITRFEDRVETRRVPVEVQRMVTETASRQVPVTVKKPVVKRYVERVPYTETRYVDVEEIRHVPVQETVYEESVEIEPYEVEVSRWAPVTREVKIPKTVTRRVEYVEEREVEKKIWVKVPVDRNGNALSVGEPVSESEMRSSLPYSAGYGATDPAEPRYESSFQSKTDKSEPRPSSVLIRETQDPTADNPGRELQPLRPATGPEEKSAPTPAARPADLPPTLNGQSSARGTEESKDTSSGIKLNDLDKITVLRPETLTDSVPPPVRPDGKSERRQEVLAGER
jgi:hypothetical protein